MHVLFYEKLFLFSLWLWTWCLSFFALCFLWFCLFLCRARSRFCIRCLKFSTFLECAPLSWRVLLCVGYNPFSVLKCPLFAMLSEFLLRSLWRSGGILFIMGADLLSRFTLDNSILFGFWKRFVLDSVGMAKSIGFTDLFVRRMGNKSWSPKRAIVLMADRLSLFTRTRVAIFAFSSLKRFTRDNVGDAITFSVFSRFMRESDCSASDLFWRFILDSSCSRWSWSLVRFVLVKVVWGLIIRFTRFKSFSSWSSVGSSMALFLITWL